MMMMTVTNGANIVVVVANGTPVANDVALLGL